MKLFLVLLLSFVSCRAPVSNHSSTVQGGQGNAPAAERESLKLNLPAATWEPIFFREINKRANIAKLPDLRKTILPSEDIEIRIWIGFGKSALKGYVFKRNDYRWSGIYLRQILKRVPSDQYQDYDIKPRSGWDKFWEIMMEEDILILPDSSELKDELDVEDGISYVVEINAARTYRTYCYSNPDFQKWPEAKKVIRIVESISQEFEGQKP